MLEAHECGRRRRRFGGSGKCMRWVSPILQSVSLDGRGMGHRHDRQRGEPDSRYIVRTAKATHMQMMASCSGQSQEISLAGHLRLFRAPGGREGQEEGHSGWGDVRWRTFLELRRRNLPSGTPDRLWIWQVGRKGHIRRERWRRTRGVHGGQIFPAWPYIIQPKCGTHRPPCPAFSLICVRTMYLLNPRLHKRCENATVSRG